MLAAADGDCMKLITFEHAGRMSYGAVKGARVVDLGNRLGRDAPTLLDLIANEVETRARASSPASRAISRWPTSGSSGRCRHPARSCASASTTRTATRSIATAPTCRSIRACSCAFRRPSWRTASRWSARRNPIQFDYEGEIALVIGKRGRRIPRAEAMAHVFGYTIANEGSVRDWLRHGKFNVTQGKNFDRSGAIGPWIVTADAMPAGPLQVTTRVNGEERQNDTTERLLFPFDYLISYLSTFTTLEPGDVILTGTPNGAGARFDPPRWLVPGDVVEVEVSGIGVLSNTVADEAP